MEERLEAKVVEVKEEIKTNSDGETNRSFKHKLEPRNNTEVDYIKIKSDEELFTAGSEVVLREESFQDTLEE